MPQGSKATLALKLVLCTSLSQNYYVPYEDTEKNPNTADGALRDAIHDHLVEAFKSIFLDLAMGLEAAGYETVPEFYTDTLMQDYELGIGSHDADVEAMITRFDELATQILTNLPDTVSKLDVAETA